jgi:hypothetical protein
VVSWPAEGGQLVVEGQLVAVPLDQLADVIAFERDRESGERAGHRDARRERRGVVEHLDRLVVPGDHHHAVVGLAEHRASLAQRVEVRVRVRDELVIPEEVLGLPVVCHVHRS